MDNRASIASLLAEIDGMTPGGFAIGLHIRFNGPVFLFQTFPQAWIDYYATEGLQLSDPAVAWSFENTGFIRWRDLEDNDPNDVMGKARAHGMRYGATLSIDENKSRSVLGCTRSDRDYLDAELEDIRLKLIDLHNMTVGLSALSSADTTALKKMSVRLSHT